MQVQHTFTMVRMRNSTLITFKVSLLFPCSLLPDTLGYCKL